MFKRTTAINKMLKMKARKKAVQGGTSSGKTHGIIPILIDRAAKGQRLKITVVAESIPAVKDGAVDIFKQVMMETGRWSDANWIGNPMEYTFKATGSRIQFKSFDTVGKAKSAGKRDILFMNECNHIPYDIADALMIRSKEVWMDYNPDNEFWVHKELLKEPNSEMLLLTYRDNEGIPPETLEDIEVKITKAFRDPEGDWNNEKNIKSHYWRNWVRVYVEGEIGSLQGVVLSNWSKIKDLPRDKKGNLECKLEGYGLDFGYTNEPTSLVACYSFEGQRIYKELIYETGLTNPQIAQKMKDLGVKRSDYVYADSSEPKSIKEINNEGFAVKPVEKGKDSINFGIQIMQENKFLVTEDSVNLIKELRNYLWDTDKSGETLNRPIDNFNHAIDACRYFEMMKKLKPSGKYYVYR